MGSRNAMSSCYCSFTNDDGEIRQWLGEPLRPSSIQVTLLTGLAGRVSLIDIGTSCVVPGLRWARRWVPTAYGRERWVRTSRVGCFTKFFAQQSALIQPHRIDSRR